MISKKLAILRRLTALLEGITPAWTDLPPAMRGIVCPYDLSKSVFRGRTEFGDEVKNPFLVLLETPRQFDPNAVGAVELQDEDWAIRIQGFAESDRRHPTDPAHDLLAWVQMRLARITAPNPTGGRGGKYPDSWKLGELVAEVRYQIPVVLPGKDNVSDTAYFYMPISVGTVTDLSMPFVKED